MLWCLGLYLKSGYNHKLDKYKWSLIITKEYSTFNILRYWHILRSCVVFKDLKAYGRSHGIRTGVFPFPAQCFTHFTSALHYVNSKLCFSSVCWMYHLNSALRDKSETRMTWNVLHLKSTLVPFLRVMLTEMCSNKLVFSTLLTH